MKKILTSLIVCLTISNCVARWNIVHDGIAFTPPPISLIFNDVSKGCAWVDYLYPDPVDGECKLYWNGIQDVFTAGNDTYFTGVWKKTSRLFEDDESTIEDGCYHIDFDISIKYYMEGFKWFTTAGSSTWICGQQFDAGHFRYTRSVGSQNWYYPPMWLEYMENMYIQSSNPPPCVIFTGGSVSIQFIDVCDYNNDKIVNFLDYAIFSQHFGRNLDGQQFGLQPWSNWYLFMEYFTFDIADFDGIIGFKDLAYFSQHYGCVYGD